ncbi:MAG: hypothetical protein WCA46_24170 [Actinocatenispora sp.]
MPAPVSILIAFGLIAGLAVVLRWTYGSDLAERRYLASPTVDDEPPQPARLEHLGTVSIPDLLPDGRHDALDPAPLDAQVEAVESTDEGYGLLRTVVITATTRQANLVREVLLDGGIRSTTATRPGGVSVLVFVHQLDQAHRLVG